MFHLDSAQSEVVNSTSDKICVIAGAGSGKTRVLTERVRRLLQQGADPSGFVCITFTKMAASELQERLRDIPGSSKMFIGTLHSLAYRTLRMSGQAPVLLTDDKETEIAKLLIEKYAQHLTMEDYEHWCKQRRLVNLGYLKKSEAEYSLSIEKTLELSQILDVKDIRYMFEYVEGEKADELAKRIIDYEKSSSAVSLPETVPSYAASHGIITFNQLLESCKEYFNGKRVKYLFVDEFQDIGLFEYRFLMSLDAENMFVVGDDYQSIYGFKGSDFEYFKKVSTDPNFTCYKLENNYRCSKKIVNFANKIISQISDVIPKNCVSTSDTNLGSRVVCQKGSKYQVEKYLRYIDPKDYGSWFLLTRSNSDLVDMSRLCYRLGIPSTTFKKSNISYEDLKSTMNDNSVKLLTIHSSKGLESDNVILFGNFPCNPEEADWGDSTEECRIYYVGATRARKCLVVIDTSEEAKRG